MTAEMTYRQLGPSGLAVSTVGLGCNNFGARMADEDVPAVVDAAIDAGITLFDTADVYGNLGGSETLLGQALGTRRSEVIIATKFGGDMQGANGRTGAYAVRAATSGSRSRPACAGSARTGSISTSCTPPIRRPRSRRRWPRSSELVSEGKVRYLGSSNLTGWQVVDADWTARSSGSESFISAQNEYSWLDRRLEKELVPALEHTGQSLLPYFPLARGLLTGKYRRGESARWAPASTSGSPRVLQRADFDTVEALQSFADERGITCCTWPSAGSPRCRPSGR